MGKAIGKVLLIAPPSMTNNERNDTSPTTSLGIGYIAAVLEKAGYEVKILDAFVEGWDQVVRVSPEKLLVGMPFADIKEFIAAEKPDVVGISSMFTIQQNNAHQVARVTKEVDPNIKVIVGGAHPTSAIEMVLSDPNVDVVVLGDTAYDANVVHEACEDRGYIWIVPANPERVYEGPTGQRPKVRSRLKDWTSLSLKTIRLRASTGKYAKYRRLSKWRVGPKQKPCVYYAYQEKCEVRSVGRVQLVFSTMKQNLKTATSDDVKILMTNALDLSVSEVIEMYSLRWQIELFFKELKSTLGFAQYSFEKFPAVAAWAEIAIMTVLFLEHERAKRLRDRRLSKESRRWWESQRLHGLCVVYRQECEGRELKYLAE